MPTGTRPTVRPTLELCDYLLKAKARTPKHGEHMECLRNALTAVIVAAAVLESYETEAERIGWENQEYCDQVRRCGFDHISPPHVLEEIEDEDGLIETIETGRFEWQDAYFSSTPCDACKTTLAGNRYHGLTFIGKEIADVNVCPDCLGYLSNGDLPY